MRPNRRAFTVATLSVLVTLLSFAGNAAADGIYPRDGTKPDGSGGYINPTDGVCVVGVAADGTMLVDGSITNARDCVAYTTGLTSMTTQTACLNADGAGNDGYRHAWTTSNLCRNSSNPAIGISLVDLDRTAAMCTSKGGTYGSTGTCTAYGWRYRNRKADGTLPFTGAGIYTTEGVLASDGLGFCYTAVDVTTATNNTTATCPSYHNSNTTAPAEWPACLSNANGCQTQASFDAGLGWSFTSSQCKYAYGVKGKIPSAITQADGTLWLATTVVDLTTTDYDTEGECLAAGFSWDNWLPDINRTTLTNADVGYQHLQADAAIVKLDAATPVKDGGGNFHTSTGAICTKCHTDQSRAYVGRNKPGYVETRHKFAGDSIGPWQPSFTEAASEWGLNGVQCGMCHGTARPGRDDIIQLNPATGNPKYASGHQNLALGSTATQLCFQCHGTLAGDPATNPAAAIAVSLGDFALTAKGVAPIGNQFLNSPHAKFAGQSTKLSIATKANYGSPFVGYACRNAAWSGSYYETIFRLGTVHHIHFKDSATNTECTNAGDGTSVSGAGGVWQIEGSSATDAQGNCTTCHDVHYGLAGTSEHAEPIRRECATCHINPDGVSAAGAPQIDLSLINHLKTQGTPLENWQTDPSEACITCHMPKSSETGSNMHLFRISTNASYDTMGPTQANILADEGYAGAAWVDLDHACGQCHGGDSGSAKNGIPYYTTAELASVAVGMHASAAVTYPVTFSAATSGLTVYVTASVNCGGDCPALTYAWIWGDGTANGSGESTSHPYAESGTKAITLNVLQNGKKVGTATRNVTVSNIDTPPTVDGTCTFNANTWTLQIQDASTDDGPPVKVAIKWGDGSSQTIGAEGGLFNHTYLKTGSFTVIHKAIDSKLKSTQKTCNVTTAYFTFGGTVFRSNGTTAVGSAKVMLKKNGSTVKTVYTAANGTFTASGLKPATYDVWVTKSGFNFANPVRSLLAIGPSSAGNVITAVSP